MRPQRGRGAFTDKGRGEEAPQALSPCHSLPTSLPPLKLLAVPPPISPATEAPEPQGCSRAMLHANRTKTLDARKERNRSSRRPIVTLRRRQRFARAKDQPLQRRFTCLFGASRGGWRLVRYIGERREEGGGQGHQGGCLWGCRLWKPHPRGAPRAPTDPSLRSTLVRGRTRRRKQPSSIEEHSLSCWLGRASSPSMARGQLHGLNATSSGASSSCSAFLRPRSSPSSSAAAAAAASDCDGCSDPVAVASDSSLIGSGGLPSRLSSSLCV